MRIICSLLQLQAGSLLPRTSLKVLLLLEELSEADDGAVYQQPSNDGHNHRWDLDECAVSEEDRKGCRDRRLA